MTRPSLYHALWPRVSASVGVVFAIMGGGCQERGQPPLSVAQPVAVRVARVEEVAGHRWGLAGTVRARHETPLAFRIGGQILRRHVQAGQRVEEGQLLFELDPRDVEQLQRAAEAQATAARVEAENAERERQRAAALLEQNVASRQAYDLAETLARATQERLRGALAQLEQARNQRQYAELRAPAAGVLIEVTGEAGQVIGPGQPVAVLAQEGGREVEVYVPENRIRSLPGRGEAMAGGAARWPVELREVAGAAEPWSRTWRARYRFADGGQLPELGSTVRVEFAGGGASGKRVPLSALLDRGSGPGVWWVRDGEVELVPVHVVQVDGESAVIEADLPAGAQVVSVGTHLLQPGQPVRPLP